jgi:hypothetical protein
MVGCRSKGPDHDINWAIAMRFTLLVLAIAPVTGGDALFGSGRL